MQRRVFDTTLLNSKFRLRLLMQFTKLNIEIYTNSQGETDPSHTCLVAAPSHEPLKPCEPLKPREPLKSWLFRDLAHKATQRLGNLLSLILTMSKHFMLVLSSVEGTKERACRSKSMFCPRVRRDTAPPPQMFCLSSVSGPCGSNKHYPHLLPTAALSSKSFCNLPTP